VDLRLGEIKASKEVHDQASMVQRHADPVMQVRHNENDFDAEFTAAVSDSLGQRQVVRIGQVIDVVPHLNGFVVIEDSPRKLRATQDTFLAIDSSVIDIERLCSPIAFGVLRLSSRLLFLSDVAYLANIRPVPFMTRDDPRSSRWSLADFRTDRNVWYDMTLSSTVHTNTSL
jgi:hypothetical protein